MSPGRERCRWLAAALIPATVASGIALVQGPPSPHDADHDPTGRYPAGVPRTGSRTWPAVDAMVLLVTFAKVARYGPDQRDETLGGLLGAAAFGVSAWIGHRRTSACRDAQAAASEPAEPAPFR